LHREVPHVWIKNLCTKGSHCEILNALRHKPSTRKDPRKDPLGHRERKIICGALIIATHKNFALPFRERAKLLPPGLPSQQPPELAQVVIEGPMERSEQLVSSIGNSDTTRLAASLNHSVANHTGDHVQPFPTKSNVSKPVLTLFSEETPGTPVATRVLEARGRSRNVRIHMSTVTLIPPGYK